MRGAATPRRTGDAGRAVRAAEDRAREAEAEVVRLRRALDALAPAVVVCDEAGRVVLRNRQTVELQTARQAAALVGRAVDDLLERARATGTATRTLELLGPPPRTLVITAAPLRHDGERVGTVAVIDDVSERRRLEAVRRDFVANVSHELRTPIGALGILAETLSEEDDPAAVRRLAARVSAETERAGRLIEDLLDLSRIEAEGSMPGQPVSVVGVLDDAAERVRQVAEGRGVVVVRGGAGGLPDVRGDRGQLVSAVANLLDNAVKYSDAGSSVQVEAGAVDGWVEVTVRDQGIGIPGRDLERIFERFYRVDRARSRETGGTGLGLSIVRHVATNHGGEVLVESREGEGSTFTLRLPEAGVTSIPELRVLLVEDEESFVEALTLGLSREGFRVEVARDGAEALDLVDSVRPDLVLLDLMLPKVSGLDVCRQIRARSAVPIIMVTARDSEVDAVVGLEVGADDYVTKPYRLRELVARMRAVLRRTGAGTEDDHPSTEALEVGDVRLDPERHEVVVRGNEVALPLREFELLELLLGNAGRVLTRDTLIDRIWGPNYVGDTKTLDVHIKRLRSRIEDDPSQPKRITTIRGLGYRYEKAPRADLTLTEKGPS